jgi:hypothetical protein
MYNSWTFEASITTHQTDVGVNKPVSEHLRSQGRKKSSQVVPLLLKRVSFVAFPPSASDFAKIAQFGEVMKKIWGVGCKGVQCSMMGELKQI